MCIRDSPEVHRLGALDHRHHQRSFATALDVDGQADPDAGMPGELGLSVLVAIEADRHVGVVIGDRSHDGVADDVGEAHLATPGAAEVTVDHTSIDLEQLGGQVAHR